MRSRHPLRARLTRVLTPAAPAVDGPQCHCLLRSPALCGARLGQRCEYGRGEGRGSVDTGCGLQERGVRCGIARQAPNLVPCPSVQTVTCARCPCSTNGFQAALLNAVLIGGANVGGTLVSIVLADCVGRRALLLQAGVQMAGALAGVAALLGTTLGQHPASALPKGTVWATLALICVFVLGAGGAERGGRTADWRAAYRAGRQLRGPSLLRSGSVCEAAAHRSGPCPTQPAALQATPGPGGPCPCSSPPRSRLWRWGGNGLLGRGCTCHTALGGVKSESAIADSWLRRHGLRQHQAGDGLPAAAARAKLPQNPLPPLPAGPADALRWFFHLGVCALPDDVCAWWAPSWRGGWHLRSGAPLVPVSATRQVEAAA